ncbi:MAG: phosphotransferase [Armatimonadetes bacterium]|nr:phosphotransferase [Armatimonadota bacterium]
MQVGWNDPDQARPTLLELWELLGPAGIKPARAQWLETGLANSSCLLHDLSGGVHFLKVYRHPGPEHAVEAALLRHLARSLPVPEVEYADHKILLTTWISGIPLQTLMREARWGEVVVAGHAAGKALATLSAFDFDQAGFLGSDLSVSEPWPSPIDGLWGYWEAVTSRPSTGEAAPLVARAQAALSGALPWMRERVNQPSLCHADFKGSNLLIADGDLVGIVDWEFAHAGTWLLDAGQLLRGRDQLPDQFVANVAHGMEEGGMDLPQNWQIHARMLDLVNLVDFLTRPKSSETVVNDVTAQIEATLQTWERR